MQRVINFGAKRVVNTLLVGCVPAYSVKSVIPQAFAQSINWRKVNELREIIEKRENPQLNAKKLKQLQLIEAQKESLLNVFQAIRLVKAHQIRAFEENIDICFVLGLDPKKGEHQVRGTCKMPGGLGKQKIVAALAEEDQLQQVQQAGADFFSQDQIIKQIKDNDIKFEVLFATNEQMVLLKPFARLLGPKGLMPNAKVGTLVTKDSIAQAVREQKLGQVTFRIDAGANIHAPLGRGSFEDSKILQNLKALAINLYERKPVSAKGPYFKKVFIKSTMGPRFDINPNYIDPAHKDNLLGLIN